MLPSCRYWSESPNPFIDEDRMPLLFQAPDNPDAEGSRELTVMHLIEDALLDPDYATLPRNSSTLAVTVLDNDLTSMQVTPQR